MIIVKPVHLYTLIKTFLIIMQGDKIIFHTNLVSIQPLFRHIHN